MTYDQILTLDSIVKYGSFKAASEALFKSQPSLSMAIKKLEEEFGFEIFNREGYRPVLTDKGHAFYQKAQASLKSFQALEHLAMELGAGIETEINICTDAIFPIGQLSDVLSQFFLPHKTTTLNLSTDVLEGVIDQLINHKVDFALGPNISDNENIEKEKILDVEMIPVIANQHITKENFNREYLQELPQIIVRSSVRDKTIRGALSNQLWFTTDFSMKMQMIRSGLGWGRLPLHMIEDSLQQGALQRISNIKGINPVITPIYLLRSKSKIMGPTTKKLWNFLVNNR